MKKINFIKTTTFLFIVLALFIISCDPAGGGDDTPSGGGNVTITACEATDRDTLVSCIEAAMKEQGTTTTPDLNKITLNTEEGTELTDLSSLFGTDGPLTVNAGTTGFSVASFNGKISEWDVSKITNFDNMFNRARKFKQDLSKWNIVAGATTDNMFTSSGMYFYAYDDKGLTFTEHEKYPIGYYEFTPINKTTLLISIKTIMSFTAADKKNAPVLRLIKTNAITDFSRVFSDGGPMTTGFKLAGIDIPAVAIGFNASLFNADVSTWNVSAGTNFSNMFSGATAFDQDLTGWTWDPAPTYSIDVTNMFTSADSMTVAKFPKICAEAGDAAYPDSGAYKKSSCK